MSTADEPRTAAGRALLGALRDRAAHVHGELALVSAINSVEDAVGLIPQIEAEARAEIDVELLARALDNLFERRLQLPVGSATVGHANAKDIADEYARLSGEAEPVR